MMSQTEICEICETIAVHSRFDTFFPIKHLANKITKRLEKGNGILITTWGGPTNPQKLGERKYVIAIWSLVNKPYFWILLGSQVVMVRSLEIFVILVAPKKSHESVVSFATNSKQQTNDNTAKGW